MLSFWTSISLSILKYFLIVFCLLFARLQLTVPLDVKECVQTMKLASLSDSSYFRVLVLHYRANKIDILQFLIAIQLSSGEWKNGTELPRVVLLKPNRLVLH